MRGAARGAARAAMMCHMLLRVRLRVVFTAADFDLNVHRAGVGLAVSFVCVCSAGC